MTQTLWDTTGGEIVKALGAERRGAGAVASGLALSMICIVDEEHVPDAEEAANVAAAAHPCRLLMVVRRRLDADERLDAEVAVGGRLGPTEAVVMRMYGRLTLHAESVVLPLLAPDAPVVTWWHGPPPDRIANDPLGVLAGRRITDSSLAPDPMVALRHRGKDFAPGDTDLAWTRVTPWRALLAAAFDDTQATPTSATVTAEPGNPSAALCAGWLAARLGVRVRQRESDGPGITEVEVRLSGGDVVRVERPDGNMATLVRSGLPDRLLPLRRRELPDLLGEELRRLDADQPYAQALEVATRTKGLDARPASRAHEWRDPAQRRAAGEGSHPRAERPKRTAKKTVEQATKRAAKETAKRAGKKAPSKPAKKTAKRASRKTAAKRATGRRS